MKNTENRSNIAISNSLEITGLIEIPLKSSTEGAWYCPSRFGTGTGTV